MKNLKINWKEFRRTAATGLVLGLLCGGVVVGIDAYNRFCKPLSEYVAAEFKAPESLALTEVYMDGNYYVAPDGFRLVIVWKNVYAARKIADGVYEVKEPIKYIFTDKEEEKTI